MAQLTGETVRKLVREIYGYTLSDQDAEILARRAQPIIEATRHLGSLGLGEVQQPFGFAVLAAEAQRIKR
ncbi:MAG: hypothetical protein ACREQB_04125 [Candidatus Binataceae bacterium]